MKLEDIIADTSLSAVTRVHAFLKLQGTGYRITSEELKARILPPIPENTESCSLSQLTRKGVLKQIDRQGRKITWQVTAKGAKSKIVPRKAPKRVKRGAHAIPPIVGEQPWHRIEPVPPIVKQHHGVLDVMLERLARVERTLGGGKPSPAVLDNFSTTELLEEILRRNGGA